MYSKWGNITHRAGADITAGALVTLNSDLEYVLAGATTQTAIFCAVADAKEGEPLAAKAVTAATGGAEVTAVSGSYTAGCKVYAAANGKVATTGTICVGFYIGEALTLSADGVVEIIFAYADNTVSTAD